jgi:SAM-dependent methyltransferase
MNYDVIESKVIRTISPEEKMLVGDERHYFRVGLSALECVDISLRAARMDVSDMKRILDLPCGHGRVLRYLRAAFAEAEITACDVMRDGVDFCASTFDAVPIYSEDDPHKIPIERDAFDLVWVGSLLTHLDSGLWLDFLNVFRSSLRPGGLLIFTTHGLHSYRGFLRKGMFPSALRDYERTGFGYAICSGSDPEVPEYYGASLSSPAWVLAQIAKLGRLRTVYFSERSWDNHQDCFACLRDDSHQAGPSGVSTYRYLRHRLAIRHRFRAFKWLSPF